MASNMYHDAQAEELAKICLGAANCVREQSRIIGFVTIAITFELAQGRRVWIIFCFAKFVSLKLLTFGLCNGVTSSCF